MTARASLVASATEVLLVAPPFATAMMPMIGPSILAAQCQAVGIAARVTYSNLRLSKILGSILYEKVGVSSLALMLGDLIFRKLAFQQLDDPVSEIDEYFRRHDRLQTTSAELGAISHSEALQATSKACRFIDNEAERLASYGARIIGFSTVFQQNLASIALARRLRRLVPQTVLVAGGANTAGPMGRELLKVAECFDVLFSGEADGEFPEYALRVLTSEGRQEPRMIDCQPVLELDSVMAPNFQDYFEELDEVSVSTSGSLRAGSVLPLETSRGCWWGAKHHCTFCGLNGQDIGFRSKSPERIVSEVSSGKFRYGIDKFQATDNIMSRKFRSEVLPRLRHFQPLDMFFEVKSNLSEDELDEFVLGGVNTIQPGIESFSTPVLKGINKGVSGVRNLWLLRECASRNLSVVWNLLVDVPGDEESSYFLQSGLIPNITHLQPPSGLSPIVIDRFSPYFDSPDEYGISDVRPLPAYANLYPAGSNLSDLAYHFSGTYTSAFRTSKLARSRLEKEVDCWRKAWVQDLPPKLYCINLDNDRLFLEDTREIATSRRTTLPSAEALLLKSLRRPTPVAVCGYPTELKALLGRHLVIELDGFVMSIVSEPEIGFSLRKQMIAASESAEGAQDINIAGVQLQSLAP